MCILNRGNDDQAMFSDDSCKHETLGYSQDNEGLTYGATRLSCYYPTERGK